MNHSRFLSSQRMISIAFFTALLSVMSQISFLLPGGMPITLQTFAITLIASILGARSAPICVFIYILIGSIGLPVFAGLKGGIQVLFGPTGGYLIGFLFMAFFIGLSVSKRLYIQVLFVILGLIFCHICGVAVYYFVTKTMLPTVPVLFAKDFATSVIALLCSMEIKKRITIAI